MKKLRIKMMILWTLLLLVPINIYAYSESIIPGGNNIGIEVNSNGVLIVGFYKVNGSFLAKEAGFMVGDVITHVNDTKVNSIDEMVDVIKNKNSKTVTFKIKRDKKVIDITLDEVLEDDNIYKTGMYVKDRIVGIGTLTYIDPNTKKFGALGHEIDEKETAKKFEIKDGKIFKSDVTGIEKSTDNHAGEKNANYDRNNKYGDINENTTSGIFGEYTSDIPNTESLKVATQDEVKTGDAIIRTVVDNELVEEYKINILRLDKTSDTKNILFEVVDQKLLDKTGGIVQGMSGSPIIQNKMIVGAVTHVIVNDTKKGYGIFITTMLEEGDN